MIKSLKFSHKILLAAAGGDRDLLPLHPLQRLLQRASIREDLEDYLRRNGRDHRQQRAELAERAHPADREPGPDPGPRPQPETTQALLEQPLLGSTFLFTYLGQTDGTYTARPQRPAGRLRPASPPLVQRRHQRRPDHPHRTLHGPAIHELVLTIASPARQGGQPFVVGGDLSLQTVVKIINSLDFGGMGYAFLVSGDGKILVHPDKDRS